MPDAQVQLTWSRIARRIRVPLGFALAAVYIWRSRPTWTSLGAGVSIALVGLVLRALAAGHIRKDRELTSTGPYAFVRNPLYLGSIILGAGFAIAARDIWIAVCMVALFLLIYVPVIRSEEAFLRQQFQEYDDYAKGVPVLIPTKIRFRELTAGFSGALYLQHREYNALLGLAGMVAALVVKVIWLQK